MPNLDLQNHYLNLVNNKVSDFKLELGRVKDEYTSAISYLQKYHLDEARENNNNYTISLLSDEDKTVAYFTKKEQKFSNAIDKINNLISILYLDENFKIKKSIDFDISAFLDIFISDYGLVKFYKNTKDQILLDFDNMFSADLAEPKPEPSAVPGASEPAKPRSISIFDTSAEKSSPPDKTKAKDTKAPEVSVGQEVDVKQLSTQDRINIESAEDQACALPSSEDLSNTKDQKYEGLYYIRSFVYNLKVGNEEYKRDFFAGVTPDGKWLASKSGVLIFARSEIVTENRIESFAVKAIDKTPERFIKWNQTGGVPKRTFFGNLPTIGAVDAKKKEASLQEAIIAHNLNYSSHFFTREEVPLLRNFEISEKKLAKEIDEKLTVDEDMYLDPDALKNLTNLAILERNKKSFFLLSSIYPDFASIKDQDIIIYIDETVTPHQLVTKNDAVGAFNAFVLRKISEIKFSLESDYTIAARGNDRNAAEKSRYNAGKKIDDLISACKIRDRLVQDYFDRVSSEILRSYSASTFDLGSISRINIENVLVCNLLKNASTELGSELLRLTQIICFASSNYIESFAANMTKGHDSSTTGILLDEDLVTQAFDQFSGSLRTQISSKITKFFDSTRSGTSNVLYCRYMASSISLFGLYINAYNFAARPVRLGWNYISCPTCKKDIYYSKYKDYPTDSKDNLVPLLSSSMGIGEERAKTFLDPAEISDYEEQRYSFFRENGELITTQDLRAASQQIGKNWDEILKRISSNNQSEHNLGIRERQELLGSMGAKKVRNIRGASVFSYKTKCPFSGGELPESIRFAQDISKKDIYIKDFSCGLSLKVDDLLNSDRKLEPYELHSAPYDPAFDAEEKLNEAINASIQKGVFSEEERESFVEELRKRRSGGWKFSNTMFRCPCKPDSNSPKNIENLKAGKYKYIASPISGFFLNNLKEERMIHPPSTESGDLHDIEDYTASYIICGDLTSLSSFCRDTSDQNSLYGILRSKIRSALNNPDQNAKGDVSNFIDTLLHLGVDFNDILPFIDKIYADEFKTAISSNHKMIFNDIIKMAEKKDMSAKSHDKNSGITRSDILGDLKLVCSNGHRFKIIDSIRFGQTHTGHSLPVNFRKLWISNPLSDIFKRTGIENLRKSLKTSIPGNHFGHTILTKVDPSTLRGMKPFSEWDGIWDPKKGLSEYYYQDFDGYCYIFESRENSVIWGDYNRKYSVMPYLERDNKTKLLFSANLLKTSDEVSGDEDGGEASLLSDQVQAERYKEAVEDSMGGEALIDTTAHERAKLDIYYSPLVVILQSALASIKDFCDRSTSIELNFPMHGKPVSLKNESEIAAIAKEIIKDFYLKQAEYSGEDEESTEDQLTRVVNDAFAYFDQNYLQDLRTQDLRLLNMLPPSTSPIEKANISRMIIRSVNYSIEDRAYELTDIHSRIFDPELKERIESELFSDLGDKIQKIVTLIKSNIEPPKTNARTGLIEGKEILMVSKLQGSEYIGRVLMMSSALYLAESVSRLYRKYLDKKSTRYIGVDIGIDLSSPEKIIKTNPDSTGSVFLLEEGSYNNISTSFPVDQLLEEQELLLDGDFSEFIDGLEEADKGSLQDIEKYQEDIIGEIESLTKKITNKQNELKNLKDSNSKDTKRINKLIDDIESYLSSLDTIKEIRENFIKIVDLYLESRGQLFLQFFDEIKDEMARVQTACTNYKYTERAVEIIKESLLKKIEVNKDMDETSRKITKTIIDRCITNSPITTISLSAGGKYHAYYSGENASSGGGPFRVLPLFNADRVIIPGLPAYAPPIYALSSSNNSFSNLGLQLSFQPIRNKHIVLYKDIDGDFIAPYPTSLPEDVVLSGWKTGLVDSDRFSIKNLKEISLYYHPFTLAVLADGTRGKPSLGDNVIGFVNSHLKYNSVAGFNFGPLSTRSGTVSLYPPLYDHGGSLGSGGSHIGLFLPLKYSKSQEKLKQTTGRVAPFFDAKIPIEIPTEQPGKTIKINISDFLLRDPPELAQQILTQISKRYVEYQNDSSNTGNKDEKLRLREECKRDIRELFDTYRNLPYGVTNTASSSHVRYEGKMGGEDPLLTSSVVASATPYIPMADFITCNRILNLEEFSPEFGGHNFWTGEDRDSAPAIKGAIEQMIIDLNSLDDLADIMNQQLNDNEIKITARDLMDPHHGVFDKIYQKVKKDIMLSRRDASEDDIRKKARELIEKITTYEVGDDYVPLSSVEDKTRKGVSYSYRADTFWAAKPKGRPLTETPKKFGRWIQSTGRFYPISGSLNPADNQPGARIKVMSEIFPFNKEDGTGRAETLRRIQDPDSSTIISHDDLNYAAFLYGQTHTMDSAYYSGKTPEEAENFRKQLKKSEGSDSMIISAVKYAAGISEFFSTNIVMGLKQRIQIEKERREIDFDRRETQYYGRAISKKASVVKTGTLRIRVAPPASVDNLRMAGMISLLSMFTK